jgi:hypothetical protein
VAVGVTPGNAGAEGTVIGPSGPDPSGSTAVVVGVVSVGDVGLVVGDVGLVVVSVGLVVVVVGVVVVVVVSRFSLGRRTFVRGTQV